MQQIVRTLTTVEPGVLGVPQVLICDRDRKWSREVRRGLQEAGTRVVLIPERAPNANAYAERFVRSIKEECLDRIVPFGERHFRRAVAEYIKHYHGERITRVWKIDSSRDRRSSIGRVAYGGARGSAGCWTSTRGRRERRLGRAMEHYALTMTQLSIRLISLEFKRDASGHVTQAVIVGYGDDVVLTKQP